MPIYLDEASANELLQMYWDEVLRGEESLSTAGNDEFYFSTERFTVSSGTEDIPIYVCDVCGKTTTMNCKDMCTTLKCGGHLRRITHDSLLKDNHYAKLYQSSLMQPLHIKEHTAQLGREEQQKYQEMFVNKEINALSCSTTFEMGVDVGDLETVYLRNMPPSPANYVQRAGRAGRGKNAAAFSLTYAKLSSHDFTYFKNPENMITGKIGVPLFTVRNEKIILRHIFAVALSDFFAKQVDVYNSNNADVLLSGDGWERFCAYLSSKPEHLKDVLKASIPESMHRVMGINDFSWTEKLVGKDGVLKVAVDEFRGTVQYYIDEYRRLLAEGLTQQAAAVEKKLWSYRRGKEDNRGRNELIEFLVRNNVLPKYGFPVDTVELYQNTNAATDKKLQMVRDLQLAISEYVSGKIDDARFAKMAKRYEQEQGENARRIKTLRLEVKKLDEKRMDVEDFLETVRRYTDATKITKRMVAELIDHIEVYPAVKEDGVTNQRVTIHYNCIGVFEVPDRRKIPERDILLETRRGVALSYAPAEVAV